MRFYFVVLFFLSPVAIWAQSNQCYDGSSTNRLFRLALARSSAPMVVDFRASKAFQINEGRLGCSSGQCSSAEAQAGLSKFVGEIPKECIRASLKRKVSQKSVECTRLKNGDWEYTKHPKGSKTAPCIDNGTVDFTHHVTNRVISCFQGLNLGRGMVEDVDPRILFSKINNESGFNFTFSYGGGTGVGQLTEWAVQEMNVLSPGRRRNGRKLGSGRFVLDAVLNSTKPECRSIRPVIEHDLTHEYYSPKEADSVCEWVSMETGLAKNLIYSMGYFSFLKHKVIARELKRLAPSAAKDPEILNLLTLQAYGPKGAKGALWLLRSQVAESSSSLAAIKQRLRQETYLRSTTNKLNEVKKIAGSSCRLL